LSSSGVYFFVYLYIGSLEKTGFFLEKDSVRKIQCERDSPFLALKGKGPDDKEQK
jgi:hypothetical protein